MLNAADWPDEGRLCRLNGKWMATQPATEIDVRRPEVCIRSHRGAGIDWNVLVEHRELLYFLIWRDVKVRYKQTVLGIAWAMLQPLAIAISLSLIFGRLVKVPAGELPYPVFAYSGMLLWQLFAQGLTESSNSLIVNERLVSKVYFPRMFVPAAAILASLVDFAIGLIVLAAFLVAYHIALTPALLLLPLAVALALVATAGIGLWMSALNVKYRDVRYLIGFFVQFWFFATPVAYPVEAIRPEWRLLYELNPMVGAVEAFRWCLRGSAFPVGALFLSLLVSAALLMSGIAYFRRTEDTFADFI